MRELFMKLFAMSHFDSGIQITPFSVAHIVYMVLIFGGVVAGYFALRHRDAEAKEKGLRFLAYALALSYFSDFFVHDFVYGGMNMDKLPFHICTVLCPLILIAQFNRNGSKVREPIAILACLAPLMYLCYPASVGSGEPWCYQALQTMPEALKDQRERINPVAVANPSGNVDLNFQFNHAFAVLEFKLTTTGSEDIKLKQIQVDAAGITDNAVKVLPKPTLSARMQPLYFSSLLIIARQASFWKL